LTELLARGSKSMLCSR